MSDLDTLLPSVVSAVAAAAEVLKQRFTPDARPGTMRELLAAIEANDVAVVEDLRPALLDLVPGSGWVEDEEEGGALPPGDWWVVDPAEGNINHIQGRPHWAVSATLVRDGMPALTVANLPAFGATYTAVRGKGAFLNGSPLRVSAKTEIGASILSTGQAMPGEDAETFARIGTSVTAMLGSALVVRMSVPATLELVDVASGRLDGFWQHSQVRSGLVAGALLVEEAGGRVTDTRGRPWSLESQDMLATAPGIHDAAVAVLAITA